MSSLATKTCDRPSGAPHGGTASGTRSDGAYQRLREDILTGKIRPNQRLIEEELAELLQVSRTPVREGLKRLAAEGLVFSRRRGWVVREHSNEEIREIYEARAALEGYCARLAAKRGTASQVEQIAAIHRTWPNRGRISHKQWVEVNDRFHDAIVIAAHNRRLAELIRANREYYFNFQVAQLYSEQEVAASLAGHDAIVRALLARDPDRAEKEMRKHIELALRVMIAKLG
jgi:DNA-binding GntR family transcriptional regulator